MCGFSGFWDLRASRYDESYEQIALKMAETIRSRGPDDEGAWSDSAIGIAFGHRRLSILDLTLAGHQPMHAQSGRFTIAYNGEVYNAFELAKDLQTEGVQFKGHSDTEIILEAIEAWGLTNAVTKFVGMFSFCLWDRKESKLYLVRDRLGIKPLYWGVINNVVLFGSQPKSFTPHPKWKGEINPQALLSYFAHNYIPAPLSIYKGVEKQRPGTILEIGPDGETNETSYWDFRKVAQEGHASPLEIDPQLAANQLEELLLDAIEKRMISDVPLGAFLSGGVDSSTVVALMQKVSRRPIKSFSIGFEEKAYNEAPHAKAVAQHLGTDHHELYVSPEDAQSVIPHLATWYDEPFADSSQIPTYLVSKMTRDHVTVALSGDGGDELFAGYTRYTFAQSVWGMVSWIPSWGKVLGRAGISVLSPQHWTALSQVIPSKWRPQHFGDKLYKFQGVLQQTRLEDFYRTLIDLWVGEEPLVPGAEPLDLWALEKIYAPSSFSSAEKLQYMDTLTYLSDDILTKVDRASMAVSLEARVPLLDHRVVEYAWRIPENLKLRDGQSKWLLRQVLYRSVPKELIERPKMGFGVPIGDWIKGPLRDWAESLLSKEALESQGLNPTPILRRWQEHLAGTRNWQYALWSVLMFQSWVQEQGRRD